MFKNILQLRNPRFRTRIRVEANWTGCEERSGTREREEAAFLSFISDQLPALSILTVLVIFADFKDDSPL